jgi:hypothetical protein
MSSAFFDIMNADSSSSDGGGEQMDSTEVPPTPIDKNDASIHLDASDAEQMHAQSSKESENVAHNPEGSSCTEGMDELMAAAADPKSGGEKKKKQESIHSESSYCCSFVMAFVMTVWILYRFPT